MWTYSEVPNLSTYWLALQGFRPWGGVPVDSRPTLVVLGKEVMRSLLLTQLLKTGTIIDRLLVCVSLANLPLAKYVRVSWADRESPTGGELYRKAIHSSLSIFHQTTISSLPSTAAETCCISARGLGAADSELARSFLVVLRWEI